MEVLRSFPRPTMLTKASNFERGSPLCSLEKKKKEIQLPYFFRAVYISKVYTLLKWCFDFHTNSYNFIGFDCWPLIFDPDFHLFGVRTRIIAQPRPYTRNMTTEIKEMKISLSSHSSFVMLKKSLLRSLPTSQSTVFTERLKSGSLFHPFYYELLSSVNQFFDHLLLWTWNWLTSLKRHCGITSQCRKSGCTKVKLLL